MADTPQNHQLQYDLVLNPGRVALILDLINAQTNLIETAKRGIHYGVQPSAFMTEITAAEYAVKKARDLLLNAIADNQDPLFQVVFDIKKSDTSPDTAVSAETTNQHARHACRHCGKEYSGPNGFRNCDCPL